MSEGVAQLKHEVGINVLGRVIHVANSCSQGSQRQVVVAGAVAGLVSRYVKLNQVPFPAAEC